MSKMAERDKTGARAPKPAKRGGAAPYGLRYGPWRRRRRATRAFWAKGAAPLFASFYGPLRALWQMAENSDIINILSRRPKWLSLA